MRPIDNSKSIQNIYNAELKKEKEIHKKTEPQDSIEISNTSKVVAKLDGVLNLGKSDRLNVGEMNGAEREEFLKMLSTILKKGIVGYEVLEINGQPEKHDVTNQIGDERVKGAKLYKKKISNE
jgi:hypothetical protein